MHVIPTDLLEVLLLEPRVFGDSRGFFLESYQEQIFNEFVGEPVHFVQDNHSGSTRNVLRGLHYQVQQAQGKLIRVIAGAVYDVAVDIRKGSPTFGRHIAVELSAGNKRMLWIPSGFAHGFLTLDEWNEVLYKTTEFYAPRHERTIRWDDPAIGIAWPLQGLAPLVSEKDARGVLLAEAPLFEYHAPAHK
jgi:dTDP-4-dehydrorhamnose 3,5-epimerase